MIVLCGFHMFYFWKKSSMLRSLGGIAQTDRFEVVQTYNVRYCPCFVTSIKALHSELKLINKTASVFWLCHSPLFQKAFFTS